MFYILEGEAILTFDDVDDLARRGDAFICSPGDVHNLWNQTTHDFRLVAFKLGLPENREDADWREQLRTY